MEGQRSLAFATNLAHQWQLVVEQVRSGQYVLKRCALFTQRLLQAEVINCNMKTKLIKNEKTKEKPRGDGMTHFVSLYNRLQAEMEEEVRQMMEYNDQVTNTVVEPLLAFHKQAEVLLKTLEDEKITLEAAEATRLASVEKSRQDCRRAWDALKALPVKKSLKISGAKSKAYKLFSSHEKLIAKVNEAQDQHLARDLPRLLTELEGLEIRRLQEMASRLGRLGQLKKHRQANVLQALEQFVRTTKAECGCKEQMAEWVHRQLREHGLPPQNLRFRSDLPCQANDFKTDAWRHILKHDDSGAAKASKRGSGPAAVHSRDLYVEVAEATRDFEAAREGSMSFVQGDLIRIVSKTVFVGEKRYWSGRLIDRVGCQSGHLKRIDPDMVRILPADETIGFRHLLQSPLGIHYLTKHLIKEYSVENLQFWKAVRDYRYGTVQQNALEVPQPEDAPTELSSSVPPESAWAGLLPDDLAAELGPMSVLPCLEVSQAKRQHSNKKASASSPPKEGDRGGKAGRREEEQAQRDFTPQDRERMVAEAKAILIKYISDSAPKQVNINSEMRDDLVRRCDKDEVTRSIFNAAHEEIFKVMASDPFSRFKANVTPYFAEFLSHSQPVNKPSASASFLRSTK